MPKLVSNVGRFALRDNSMIFSNVVNLVNEKDKRLYHLIDENGNELDSYMGGYIVDDNNETNNKNQ